MKGPIPLLGQDTPRINPCLPSLLTIRLSHDIQAVGTSGYALICTFKSFQDKYHLESATMFPHTINHFVLLN